MKSNDMGRGIVEDNKPTNPHESGYSTTINPETSLSLSLFF